MSRIGKKPVPLAAKVKAAVEGRLVRLEGPKGKLQLTIPAAVSVSLDEPGRQLIVTRADDLKSSKALHGLTRALLNNMVVGVTEGYRKSLEVQGVGYKAELKTVGGKKVVELWVGFANTISLPVPAGVDVQVEGNKIHVFGPDKQLVGQFAADLRKIRKPEPYKGKGIRYEGEVVKIKPGKAVTGGAAK